jgi:hypothetical protein
MLEYTNTPKNAVSAPKKVMPNISAIVMIVFGLAALSARTIYPLHIGVAGTAFALSRWRHSADRQCRRFLPPD